MSALAWYRESSITTFSHARHALVEALRRSNTPPGATVLLPGFICRDLLAAIHAVGARPDFYAVDPDLQPVDLLSHSRAHAVIAVDYFGIPQDMEPFRALRDRHGTIVIEDAAHGFLGRDESGALLGTRGDFGLLSMRKTFHLPDGAALLDLRPNAVLGDVGCEPGRRGSLRRNIAELDRATGLPLMSSARSLVRVARRMTGRPTVPPSDNDEERLPEGPRISCSALRTIDRLDPDREARRRRDLLVDIAPEVDAVPGVTAFAHRFGPLAVPYGVPFRAAPDRAAAVARAMRRYHVVVMPWPDLPRAIAPEAPDHYRDVWLVNFI